MNKEVKAALRQIKGLLKVQQYEEAVEACQALIERNVTSPEIHTFHAFSLSHLSQCEAAEQSYLAALGLDEGFPNALMGLSEIYINNENLFDDKDMLKVFTKLIELDLYPAKLNVFLTYITKCYWRMGLYEECMDNLKRLYSTEEDPSLLQSMLKKAVDKNCADVYKRFSELLDSLDNLELLEDRLQFHYSYCCYQNRAGRDTQCLRNSYKELVYQLKGNFDSEAGSSAGSSVGSPVAEDDTTLTNWARKLLHLQLMGLWSEMRQWNGSPHLPLNVCDLSSLSSTLHLLKKTTCYDRSIANILFALDEGRTDNALELCKDNMKNKLSPELYFLSAVAYSYDYKHMNRLMELVTKAKEMLVPDPSYDKVQLLVLVERFQCYLCYTLALPLTPGDDVISKMWSVLCLRDRTESADDRVTLVAEVLTSSFIDLSHPMYHLAASLHALDQGKVQGAIGHVVQCVYKDNYIAASIISEVSEAAMEAGLLDPAQYYEDLALSYKLDRHSPVILRLMGNHYKRSADVSDEDSYEQAAKFYLESLKRKPDIKVLAILDSLKQSEGVKMNTIKGYKLVTEVYPLPSLLIRLSLMLDDNDDSIKYLRRAAELDNKNALIFELLGDKYLTRGSYKSASKAYQHAYTLEPTSYRKCNIAAIRSRLGKGEEALAIYKEILAHNSAYSPAIRGSIACLYTLVQSAVEGARYPHAVHLANQCLAAIESLAMYQPSWSCTWKHLGDLCQTLHPLAESSLTLTPCLAELLGTQEVEYMNEGVARLGVLAYRKAVCASPGNSLYLLDLSAAYFRLSEVEPLYISHALALTKRVVKLRPRDHLAWNLLGTVCLKGSQYKLAQHALIKSVTLCPNNHAWTNLGILYFLKKAHNLANQAFSKAQSVNTDYTPAWVGQARLAECMGHVDAAAGLFRDIALARSRPLTVEGTLGYMLEACRKRKEDKAWSEDMHEATTILNRCCELSGAGWLSHNLLGVSAESVNMLKLALQHYVRAQSSCPDTEYAQQVQNNVNRVQCRLGNYSAVPPFTQSLWGAVSMFRQDKPSQASAILDKLTGPDVASFQAVLSAGDYDKASKFFSQATDSEEGKLLEQFNKKCFKETEIFEAEPGLQVKYTVLYLATLQDKEEFSITQLPNLYPCLQVMAKHKSIFGPDYNIAVELVHRLHRYSFYHEELFDIEFQGYIKSEDYSQLLPCAQRAKHMYPWREQSDAMMRYCETLPSVDCS